MREIGTAFFPDEPTFIVSSPETHPTETPIRFTIGQVTGEIRPGEKVIMPATLAAFFKDDSGYAVEVSAIEPDPELESAVANVERQAKAKALVALSVEKLTAALADLDLETLNAVLEAEKAKGDKARVSAVDAIEAAIAAQQAS